MAGERDEVPFEITQEMISAGVHELYKIMGSLSLPWDSPAEQIVVDIYHAMQSAIKCSQRDCETNLADRESDS